MPPEHEKNEALTYFEEDEVDVVSLCKAFRDTVSGIGDYLDQTRVSYDDRHEIWPGKSHDHRKHGPAAFPWDGASDLETRIVEDRIRTYVALCVEAMARSHIQAYPVESGDMVRARVVSAFLKWMVTTWIEGFDQYLDRTANYLFEKGLIITYCGWEQRKTRKMQRLSLEEIAAQVPELAEIMRDPSNDETVIAMMQQTLDVQEKRAKKALKQLRETGEAELPVAVISIDRPMVRACQPDSEVLYPSWCIDPHRAPYVFYRDFMTVGEVLNRVETDGWDPDWADYVIEHFLGETSLDLDGEANNRRGSRIGRHQAIETELIEVICCYQRLIDEEDGAEGIYRTYFHLGLAEKEEGSTGADLPRTYAKRELLPDLDEFPFVVTELSSDERRLYEVTTFPDMIRSAQHSIKVERDSRIDRNSLATVPPLFHPAGRPPHDWGPKRYIGYRRRDEIYFGDTPRPNPDAVAMDMHLIEQIDRVLGLHPDDPHGNSKKRYYIEKFLRHVRDVLAKCYDLYKLYGPPEKFFRVTGLPEQMQMVKLEDEDLDIVVSFDTLQTDPDTVESQLRQLFQIIPLDQGGRINMDAVITFAASAISPTLAGQILQPSQQGAQDLLRQFTEDWAKLYSGVEVDAPPNGAGVILPAMQGLQSQPDVVQRYQSDEAFKARVDNYMQQLQFQMQQAQNAEIGRRGAKPADITLNQAPYPQQNGPV